MATNGLRKWGVQENTTGPSISVDPCCNLQLRNLFAVLHSGKT